MTPHRVAALAFLAGALGYLALSFALFEMPATLADAEHCGFLPEEFAAAAGGLTYERTDAWWVSFRRMEEGFSLLSVALAVGFAGYALAVGRGAGGAGAALGGGLLALSAVCVSCLAPVLSVVGLGLAGSLLAGVPKSLILLNTVVLTGWGALHLSRKRAAGCPVPGRRAQAA